MNNIFNTRINFSFSDPDNTGIISKIDANTFPYMGIVPRKLLPWQANDIESGDVTGYFINPVGNVTSDLILISNTLISNTTTIHANTILYPADSDNINLSFSNTYSISSNISNTAGPNFLYLTNRLSNVTGVGTDAYTPHYNNVMSYGRTLMGIVYSTDGIQTNAPLLGGMTSLFISNTLTSLHNTLRNSSNLLSQSKNTDDISSLSLSQARQIESDTSNVYNILTQYYTDNINFHRNTISVINDFNTVSQFGPSKDSFKKNETQAMLITHYIGSEKLLSRIT